MWAKNCEGVFVPALEQRPKLSQVKRGLRAHVVVRRMNTASSIIPGAISRGAGIDNTQTVSFQPLLIFESNVGKVQRPRPVCRGFPRFSLFFSPDLGKSGRRTVKCSASWARRARQDSRRAHGDRPPDRAARLAASVGRDGENLLVKHREKPFGLGRVSRGQ